MEVGDIHGGVWWDVDRRWLLAWLSNEENREKRRQTEKIEQGSHEGRGDWRCCYVTVAYHRLLADGR